MYRASMLEAVPGMEEVCISCHAEKPVLVAIKGDANSYYKKIRLPFIVEAMEGFRQITRDEVGTEAVTLLRKFQWKRGFFGGSVEARTGRIVTFTLGNAQDGLVFEIRDAAFASIAGVVIELLYPGMGAVMSEVVCGLVASWFEYRINKSCTSLIAAGLLPSAATSPAPYFASVGHVDDMGTVSRTHCASCCLEYQQHCLPREIGYGLKGQGEMFRFLVAVIDTTEGRLKLHPYNANWEFAVGKSSEQAVVRARPCLGYEQWSRPQLHSYVAQKMASHRHVLRDPDISQQRILLLADVLLACEILRLEYPLRLVYKVWRALPPNRTDSAVKELRCALKNAVKHGAEGLHPADFLLKRFGLVHQ